MLDVTIMNRVHQMSRNAMFLLTDLRTSNPSRSRATTPSSSTTSNFTSPKHRASSPTRDPARRTRSSSTGSPPPHLRRHASDTTWQKHDDEDDMLLHTLDMHAPRTLAGDTAESIDDDDEYEEEGESGEETDETEDEEELQLRRVQSDLHTTPTKRLSRTRGSINKGNISIDTHTRVLPSISEPNSGGRRRTRGRRMSDGDLQAAKSSAPIATNTGVTQPTPNSDEQNSASVAAMPRARPHLAHQNSKSKSTNTAHKLALSSWTGASSLKVVLTNEEDLIAPSPSQPLFDADWISSLIHSEKPLGPSLSQSIQSLQTALLLRVKLLQELNRAFQAGYTRPLVDDVLGIIWRGHVIRHIQTSSSLRARNKETEDVLLFFYKHLGQTLNTLDMEHADRAVWSRIKTILHFFSIDFHTQDVDIILGSGMLAVLSRFIQKEDAAESSRNRRRSSTFGTPGMMTRSLLDPSQQSLAISMSKSLVDDEMALAVRMKSWAWLTFMYLTTNLLARPFSHQSKHQQYVLASSVGQQLTTMLKDHIQRLGRAARSGSVNPITQNGLAQAQQAKIDAQLVRHDDA